MNKTIVFFNGFVYIYKIPVFENNSIRNMAFEELNNNFYTEKSVLDILKLIQWKRETKKYSFKTLPKTSILILDKSFIDRKTRFFSKKIKGINGFHYQVNSKLLLSSCFGNGAPAMVGLLEELRGLGVKNFIFIGFSGSLTDYFKENEVCIVTKSYSTTGSTIFYSSNNYFKPIKTEWFSSLDSKLNYKEAVCWSTDAPFRETPSLITRFKERGSTHVDMECAAIYAFAEFYNVNSLCVLVTADSLSEKNWKHPKNNITLNKTLSNTLKNCIKIISND